MGLSSFSWNFSERVWGTGAFALDLLQGSLQASQRAFNERSLDAFWRLRTVGTI